MGSKNKCANQKSQLPKLNSVGLGTSSTSLGFNELLQNLNVNTNCVHNNFVNVNEKQLEDMLINKLDSMYNQAVDTLIGSGYDKETVVKAILRYGHCYGKMDVFTNVIYNTTIYLASMDSEIGDMLDDSKAVFRNLKELRDFALMSLVSLVERAKPCSSRGDAMWSLLESDLHVGRASDMELTVVPNPNGEGFITKLKGKEAETGSDGGIGVRAPDSCRFHGGWEFGKEGVDDSYRYRDLSVELEETVKKDVTCPTWLLLSPFENLLMRSTVALFAAEYNAKMKRKQLQSEDVDASKEICFVHDYTDESLVTLSLKNEKEVEMILKKCYNLNMEEDKQLVVKDSKDEMLITLVNEIKDLENQVKERKVWANQKVLQATRKLSHDLTELKMLRMEMKEVQQVKQEKPTVDDPTVKKLSEMISALLKASGDLKNENMAVRRLEFENAEIRAEIEASNLRAAESVTMCLAVAKREKKYLKKLLTWEKQRAKLQEDIAGEKQKLIELQEEMVQVEAATKTAEAEWKEEQKAKERAVVQVEEENCLKEASELDSKRNHETLRSKFELDFRRYKDDLRRLEQELSLLKISEDLERQSTFPYRDATASLLSELDDVDERNEIDRACIICKKDEASAVFLPCAHQVLCGSCNDEYGKKEQAKCPTCRVLIEQIIRVFGVSS